MVRQDMKAAAILLAAMAVSPAALAQTSDFPAFWKAYAAAVAKDDKAALETMTKLRFDPDGDPSAGPPKDFKNIHDRFYPAKNRACLAKAKPKLDKAAYFAFCGQLIYQFEKAGDSWALVEIGAND